MCDADNSDPKDVIENQCPCVNGVSNTVSNWVCMDPSTFVDGFPVKHEDSNSETCTAVAQKSKEDFGDFCDLQPYDFENDRCPDPVAEPPVRRGLLRGS
jgi:hypothetical protein